MGWKLIKAKPTARIRVNPCGRGLHRNVLPDDLLGFDVLLRLEHDGEPLTGEYGGLLRLGSFRISMPGKASSGCADSSFSTTTALCFWERNGYHAYSDPGKSSATRALEHGERSGRGKVAMKNFDGFNDSETLAYFSTTKSRARSRRSDLKRATLLPLFPKARTTLYLASFHRADSHASWPLWNHPKTVARAFASDESLPSRDRWVK